MGVHHRPGSECTASTDLAASALHPPTWQRVHCIHRPGSECTASTDLAASAVLHHHLAEHTTTFATCHLPLLPGAMPVAFQAAKGGIWVPSPQPTEAHCGLLKHHLHTYMCQNMARNVSTTQVLKSAALNPPSTMQRQSVAPCLTAWVPGHSNRASPADTCHTGSGADCCTLLATCIAARVANQLREPSETMKYS
jgi:hypothetical protein